LGGGTVLFGHGSIDLGHLTGLGEENGGKRREEREWGEENGGKRMAEKRMGRRAEEW
jgi:hypothetical protein